MKRKICGPFVFYNRNQRKKLACETELVLGNSQRARTNSFRRHFVVHGTRYFP